MAGYRDSKRVEPMRAESFIIMGRSRFSWAVRAYDRDARDDKRILHDAFISNTTAVT